MWSSFALVTRGLNIFSWVYFPFLFPRLWNACLLSIFPVGSLYFSYWLEEEFFMFLIERCKYISLHIQDNNLLCMCVAIPRSPVHTHTHIYGTCGLSFHFHYGTFRWTVFHFNVTEYTFHFVVSSCVLAQDQIDLLLKALMFCLLCLRQWEESKSYMSTLPRQAKSTKESRQNSALDLKSRHH